MHSFSPSLRGGLVIKSCPTLGTPWPVAPQASLSMGFSRQESWSGLPFPSQGDLLDPGVLPRSLMSLALAGRFFTTDPSGKPLQPFPAVCTECAGVPGVQTGQQDPPQSGSTLANKVVTQPCRTDNDSRRIGSKAFSSSVTPTTFQVLRSIMWPGAMVLDRADI